MVEVVAYIIFKSTALSPAQATCSTFQCDSQSSLRTLAKENQSHHSTASGLCPPGYTQGAPVTDNWINDWGKSTLKLAYMWSSSSIQSNILLQTRGNRTAEASIPLTISPLTSVALLTRIAHIWAQIDLGWRSWCMGAKLAGMLIASSNEFVSIADSLSRLRFPSLSQSVKYE